MQSKSFLSATLHTIKSFYACFKTLGFINAFISVLSFSSKKKFQILEENSYRKLMEKSPYATLVEHNGYIIFANESAIKLFEITDIPLFMGLSWKNINGLNKRIPLHELLNRENDAVQENERFERKITRRDNTIIHIEIIRTNFNYNNISATQIVIHDISKHKKQEEQLRQQALHDALTGLPNRLLLIEHLRNAINRAERQQHSIFVLFFDLDRFKYINDTLGHDAGDDLLKTISKRISECVRSCDTLARLGGDEFVLLLDQVTDEERASTLIQRIIKVVSEPIVLNHQDIKITCSIGLSVYPHDGRDVNTLLKYADTAMYRAKSQGRNGIQRYCAKLETHTHDRLLMESFLRYALIRNEFILHYQPMIDLRSGNIVGAEALIRWNHPQLGVLPPSQFISLAEETGLIIDIGKWVIHTACTQVKLWRDAGMPEIKISINLSAQQLNRPDLEDEIKIALNNAYMPPHCLELEITESMSMADPEATVLLLSRLKAMGVSLAIDDFGTGYSNLFYLKRFPVNRLKIDRSFIHDLARDPNDLILIHAIITMAHNLNLTVVGEGIEEISQLKELIAYGCDEMQGYYFSPPVSPEKFFDMYQSGISLKNIQQETKVVYPGPESTTDTRYNDLIEILTTALDKTIEEYGPYSLKPSINMTEARLMAELEQGGSVNIAWSSTSVQKEEKYLPIRIPLRKGLLGYRICLINEHKQALMNQIHSIDDLKKLNIGQGIGWGDINVYKDSGINITTAPYSQLFKMTASGYLDIFPRGIAEAPLELLKNGPDNPSLTIEKNLAIYYPWPYYFFFNKNDHALAKRIEKGLYEMINDGTFDVLFKKHNASSIRQANLKQRRIINIENPFLPKATPLDNHALWFNPSNYQDEE